MSHVLKACVYQLTSKVLGMCDCMPHILKPTFIFSPLYKKVLFPQENQPIDHYLFMN